MRTSLLVLTAALGLLCAQAGAAGIFQGVSDQWSDPLNWDDYTPPSNGTAIDVTFSGTGVTQPYVSVTTFGDGTVNSYQPYNINSLTFNADNDFVVSMCVPTGDWRSARLSISGNVSAGVDNVTGHTYTIGGTTEFTGGTHLITVGTGSTLAFSVNPNNTSYGDFSTTATTVLNVSGGGEATINCNYGGIAQGTQLILSTTLTLLGGANYIDPENVSDMSKLVINGGWWRPYYNSAADHTWETTYTAMNTYVEKTGNGTLTLAGTEGKIVLGGGWPTGFGLKGGVLRLDNKAVNSLDRFQDDRSLDVGGAPFSSMFELVGSDVEETTELIGGLNAGGGTGLAIISVRHGEGQNAILTFDNFTAGGAFLYFSGNDLGGNGTNYSRIMFNNNGSAVTGIVGADFAAYDPVLGVVEQSEAGRPTQIEGAGASADVVVSDPQNPLTYDQAVKSLKIKSSGDIDLSDKQLEIKGGYILKSGDATRITNGRLYQASSSFKLVNDGDLEINAELKTPHTDTWGAYLGTVTKLGAGKLKLSSTFSWAVPHPIHHGSDTINMEFGVKWAQGDLEIDVPDYTIDVPDGTASSSDMLPQTVHPFYAIRGSSGSSGKLIKNGSGKLLIGDSPNGQESAIVDGAWGGGTEINDGLVQLGYSIWWATPIHLGTGPAVMNGGTLRLIQPLGSPLTMNGGTIEFNAWGIGSSGLTDASTITLGTGKTGTFKWISGTPWIRGLDGDGTLAIQGGNAGNWAAHFNLGPDSGASDTFTGSIDLTPGSYLQADATGVFPRNMRELTIESGSGAYITGSNATDGFNGNIRVKNGGLLYIHYNTNQWPGGVIVENGGTMTAYSPSLPAVTQIDAGGTLDANWSSGSTFNTKTIQGGGQIVMASNQRLDLQSCVIHPQGTLTLAGRMSLRWSDTSSNTRFIFDLNSATDYGNLFINNTAGTDGLSIQGTTGTNRLHSMALEANIAAKKNWLGKVLTVLTINSITGTDMTEAPASVTFNNTGFADVTVSGVAGGSAYITLSNISYPGDANRDGITDMSDYIIWFNNFGQTNSR
ncbi:MAG: hypothetical protein ACE15C_20905 [Phycisphaerae bacterium]